MITSIPIPAAVTVGQSVPELGRVGGVGVGLVPQTQFVEDVQDGFLQYPL